MKNYPKKFCLKFKDGNRDNFLNLLRESLQLRVWEKIQVNDQKSKAEPMLQSRVGGIAGIHRNIQIKTASDAREIKDGF